MFCIDPATVMAQRRIDTIIDKRHQHGKRYHTGNEGKQPLGPAAQPL